MYYNINRYNYTDFYTKYSKKEQPVRQCTYNAILRRVPELLLPWKSNKYCLLVCVCVRARACVYVRTRARGSVHAHTCMKSC